MVPHSLLRSQWLTLKLRQQSQLHILMRLLMMLLPILLALQNISDAIQQGLLPQPASPVLELSTVVAHDDVHSLRVEQTHPDDQDMSVPTSPAAADPVPSIVEHVDVHEDIVSATEVSNLLVQHTLAQEEVPSASSVQVKSPIEHNNSVVQIKYEHGQVQNQYVAGHNQEVVPAEGAVRNSDLATDDSNTVRHGDGPVQHINPNIQQDMDL
ncbi:hypothetical protein MtrunA17_Chr1g0153031 [Medicago truncatula]|uniref:Uncharacterized protein n=1 Tax=Medicago truncatula TaxID=3880 RepID=Q2HTP7_MEDTR|nr:hypothetical protein MtrDRAFT_AC150207g24v2 [Medicago truncatula]RHN77276.1 hypothetical protein MtrunA17_Chr1g0153031 [Medicago truncatula]